MDPLFLIFTIVILIMSVVIHELSHAYTADLLGDITPRLEGRLTLNPIKHLELFGSVIVPILTSLGGFTFGWAKPVRFNPDNLKNRRWGELLIALAGPLSNIVIALVFGFLIRANIFGSLGAGASSFIQVAAYVVLINIVLAVFNLVPIPPLDGSKVLFNLLPQTPAFNLFRANVERYSLVLMLVVAFFLWRFIAPIVPVLFRWVVGV